MISTGGTYTGENLEIHLNTAADYMNDFVRDFEDKIAKDKAKKKETEAAKLAAAAEEEANPDGDKT